MSKLLIRAALRACLIMAPAVALVLAAVAAPATARADDAGFRRFVENFWPRARRAGVSRAAYERAFRGVRPDPEVLEKAAHQPEFVKPVWAYLDSAVSQSRIETGREMARRHSALLDELEKRYGVDRHILLAIWGMESAYGAHKGDRQIVRSLATLAWRGSRRSFGRSQLVAALKIIQNGDTAPQRMMGSWAGAMGHTQFIPTTYEAYAVDHDGDGRRDIWNTLADALASTASYLERSGWRSGETWGYEVRLPEDFDYRLATAGAARTLAEWRRLGVERTHGKAFPRPGDRATLFLPAGAHGPAFVLLKNFRVLLRYNNANSYALAVGHLADRLRDPGFPGFSRAWPRTHRPLSSDQRVQLQRLLASKGFLNGKVDGIVGPNTRAAVRGYQRARGLTADGHPHAELLERLKQDS